MSRLAILNSRFGGSARIGRKGADGLLYNEDVNDSTDRRIADAISAWTGEPGPRLAYTRDPAASSVLLALMERFGRRGQLAEARINEREAFLYICARRNGSTFAQGLGTTPALAMADAFLGSREDPPRKDRPTDPPAAPLFRAVGFEPSPAPEKHGVECINCGWEGATPSPDPRRCPSCRRNFLRPAHRKTQ